MEKENNIKDTVEKVKDTLLVLNNMINTIRLVQGIDKEGNLKEVLPGNTGSQRMIRIDADEGSFTSFFSDFYNQLKNPSDFSFFKVTEYEAAQTAKELQDYVKNASEEERRDLKQYEVFIERVEAHRNQSPINNTSTREDALYRYEVEQINWSTMENKSNTIRKFLFRLVHLLILDSF